MKKKVGMDVSLSKCTRNRMQIDVSNNIIIYMDKSGKLGNTRIMNIVLTYELHVK